MMKKLLLLFILLFSLGLNAQTPNTIYVTGSSGEALHLYDNQLYFSNGYTLSRCNLDGSNVTHLFEIPDIGSNYRYIKSIKSNSSGAIFVISNEKIYKWSISAGLSVSVEFPDVNPNSNPVIIAPWELSVDSNDKLIIFDIGMQRVGKFQDGNNYGEILLEANNSIIWQGECYGLALDQNDNIYISESGENRIIKYNISSSVESIFFGTGIAGNGLDQIASPSGLHIQNNNLYIADRNNNRIQRKALINGGLASTVAGRGFCGSKYDRICNPTSSVFDNYSNSIYVNAGGIIYKASMTGDKLNYVAGEYHFENNLIDKSVGANIFPSDPITFTSDGLNNSSLYLNNPAFAPFYGVIDIGPFYGYYDIGNQSNRDDFTISMWVNQGQLLYGVDNVNYLSFGHSPYSKPGIRFRKIDDKSYIDFSINEVYTNETVIRYNIDEITDTWIHYAISYRNGQLNAYVNGQKVGSVPSNVDYALNHNIYLGVNFGVDQNLNPPSTFKGKIDELYIFNKMLSDTEVNEVYSNDFSPKQYYLVNLNEDIYEPIYDVLQQSIVHRYYIVKKTSDNLPQVGVKIKYSLSNKPKEFFYSELSDEKGLIDLAIKTGGNDQTITTDDIIPANQLSLVSFVGIEQNGIGQTVASSEFGTDDFGISVYATAEPEEKEYGISGGYAAGIGVGAKGGINLGGVEVTAGVASYKIGAGLGGGMLITPEHNSPNKWDVELDLDTEYFLDASVGPEVDAEIPEIVTYSLGASANGKLSGGERQKFGYRIDLDTSPNQNLYQLAHQILLLKSREYPNLLRASNFFKRMSAISLQKTTVGVGYGAAANLDVNAGMGLSASFFNDENISTGLGLEVAGGGEIAIETINTYDLDNFTNVHENKITVGTSASVGLEFINGYDYGEDIEVEAVIPLPHFFSYSRSYSLTMAREMLGTGVRNMEATYGSSTLKTVAGKEVEVEYSYTTELNHSLTQKVISNYKNNQTKTNTFADFVTFGKTSETSLFSIFPASSNFFTHYIDFNKMASRLHTDSQDLEAISQKVDRYYTRKVGGEIPFSGTFFLELSFDLNLEGWTTYKNPLAEYKYIPSIQRILPVLDRPDNDLFVEIPQNDPFTIVWNKVQTALSSEAQNVVNQAYGFVNKTFENVSSTVRRFYTNLGFNQLSLNATTISAVKPIVEKGILSTTPSVLTFDVPPAPTAFAAGTEIRFSFYYPENLLKAKIGVDTFQIITDVFYLNALSNGSRLVSSPNGNFNVVTQFSTFDLQRTSLPLGSVVKVVFLPEGSRTWEIFDEVNQTKATNRLGVYAIAAKLEYDKTSPIIQITNPTTTNQRFEVTISETQSGINWANTVVIVNGNLITFPRTIGSNIIQVNLSSIPVPGDGVYNFEVRTSDLSNNSAVAKSLYPCESSFKINSVTSSLPKQYKAKGLIESTAALPSNSQVDFKSEKAIILKPGFEIRGGKTFKAEIGGCNN